MEKMDNSEKLESDDEYEEEEVLIYLDVDTFVTQKEIIDPNVQIKILGIEEKKPIMQINDRVFEGEYSLSLGTNVLFHEDFLAKPDPVFGKSKVLYKYFDKTNKVLKMTRISVSEKSSQMEEISEENEAVENQKYKITKTYQESLNLFLEPGVLPPRDIPEPENGAYLVALGNKKLQAHPIEEEEDIDEPEEPDNPDNDEDYVPSRS